MVVVYHICLLYTSDAADERSSVDLGGRRIIKKKTTVYLRCRGVYTNKHSNTTWSEEDHKNQLN